MAKPQRIESDSIPALSDMVQVRHLDRYVRLLRESTSTSALADSLSSFHYIQTPFDSDVEGIPARNASYFRLVMPTRVSQNVRRAIEFGRGPADTALSLKTEVGRRLVAMSAERPAVAVLDSIAGKDITGRVHEQDWYEVIAGVAAGYSEQAGEQSKAHISLIYARKLNLTEHFLRRHIDGERLAGREIPQWMDGIASEEPVLSSAEERTRRLAGMMAQSMLLHTWED